MLRKLLRSTEWRQLSAFASPAFFDVVSVRDVYKRARTIRTSRHDPRFRRALETRARTLREVPLAVELPGGASPETDHLGEGVTADATRIVTLYFHQLFGPGPTLLDLRSDAFTTEVSELVWKPAHWVCDWSDDFLPPLREVYTGFYRGEDQRFTRGLRELNLESAADLFREHFGGEQEDQEFVMADFVRTFHQVFVRCSEQGVRLHPDFLPLGVYLAALYDCLDGQPVRVNVRECFQRATAGREQPPVEVNRESTTHG